MPNPVWRLALVCAALAAPAASRATGAVMFTGPVAIPRDLVSPDEPAERGLRLFALGSTARTELDFTKVTADLEVNGLQLGVVKRTAENGFVMVSGGLQALGALDPGGGPSLELDAGLLVQAAATWRVWEGYDEEPFVTVTVGLSILRGKTAERHNLDTNDLSFGLAVGRAFDESWAPYVAVKGLAGPASWRHGGERVRGGDAHRWAAAAGLLVALDSGWDVQAELSPVGARAATVAIGRAW